MVTCVVKKSVFASLAADIKPIALIAMPVWWYVRTEDSTTHR